MLVNVQVVYLGISETPWNINETPLIPFVRNTNCTLVMLHLFASIVMLRKCVAFATQKVMEGFFF